MLLALAAAAAKAAGGLLALARPGGRVIPRGWLRAGSARASALLVYGGLNVLLGALVLSGVIHPAASVDRTALWLARRGLGPVVPGVGDLAGAGYRRLLAPDGNGTTA